MVDDVAAAISEGLFSWRIGRNIRWRPIAVHVWGAENDEVRKQTDVSAGGGLRGSCPLYSDLVYPV